MVTSSRTDVVLLAANESLIGLAAGFGGALITAAITAFLQPLPSLFGSIFCSLIVGLIALIGGVGVVGYRYLKESGREQKFVRQLVQGVLGTAVGLITFWYVILMSEISNSLVNTAAVALPLLGLLIGFNHRIRYT